MLDADDLARRLCGTLKVADTTVRVLLDAGQDAEQVEPRPEKVLSETALLLLFGSRVDKSYRDVHKAIRAVAKEKLGAELAGIDVAHIYAVTFGVASALLAVAACLLIPTYYVNPSAGNAFVLIAFTVVVLGGMGSVAGALVGGLFVGVVESLSGLYLGESLGQIGIFLVFIVVLLVRPSGLFGERA